MSMYLKVIVIVIVKEVLRFDNLDMIIHQKLMFHQEHNGCVFSKSLSRIGFYHLSNF